MPTLVLRLARGRRVLVGESEGTLEKTRWHIDYLLSDKDVNLTAIVAGIMSQKMECAVNRCLREMFRAQIPFLGFGSSDCTEHCSSHLLFLGQTSNVVEKTVELYKEKADGDVFVFRFQ
jgi:Uri superfamily endonuclease